MRVGLGVMGQYMNKTRKMITMLRGARCWSVVGWFAFCLAFVWTVEELGAHGSVGDPVSRVYQIFLEDPQSPDRPVSADAIAVAGTQAFYDWSEVNILVPDYGLGTLDVYQSRIPDGQLASAGRGKYFGLDLVRDDWPATPVNAGPYPVVFDAHVPHDPSYFRAFISKDGWSPDQPLNWDDLEELAGPENAIRDGSLYRFQVDFPPRVGRMDSSTRRVACRRGSSHTRGTRW